MMVPAYLKKTIDWKKPGWNVQHIYAFLHGLPAAWKTQKRSASQNNQLHKRLRRLFKVIINLCEKLQYELMFFWQNSYVFSTFLIFFILSARPSIVNIQEYFCYSFTCEMHTFANLQFSQTGSTQQLQISFISWKHWWTNFLS